MIIVALIIDVHSLAHKTYYLFVVFFVVIEKWRAKHTTATAVRRMHIHRHSKIVLRQRKYMYVRTVECTPNIRVSVRVIYTYVFCMYTICFGINDFDY